jgi:hypothetical protein
MKFTSNKIYDSIKYFSKMRQSVNKWQFYLFELKIR